MLPRAHFLAAPATFAGLAAVFFAVACDGCPSSRPYTPYTLGSAGSSAVPTPIASGSGAGVARQQAQVQGGGTAPAPAFTVVPGVAPPEEGKRWPLGGGAAVDAPTGRTFETGLVIDGDGDGVRDLIAWARAPDGLRGELRFAPGARPNEGRTLAALPGDLSARGCTPRASLAQIGPATLAFDFAPQCGAGRRGKATRWIAIVRLAHAGAGASGSDAGPELVLELRLREPPPDETLSAELDAADRDGDGRDDLAVVLSISGALRGFAAADPAGKPGPAPPPRVPLVFLDRPAGLSRDPSQPGAALRALAVGLLTDARRKDLARSVGPAVHALRRLHALVCADAGDAGTAVVSIGATPLRCGEPGLRGVLAQAEASAASTAGDPLAALAALDHEGPRSKDEVRLLAKLTPPAEASVAHRVSAVPEGRDGWGPLAFEPSGDLLVRTPEGVVRVDRVSFAEATAGVTAWPTALVAGGTEIIDVERRCDTPTLVALIQARPGDGTTDGEPRPIPLPMLPPEARCAGTAHIPITPLGVSDSGLDLAIGATLISINPGAASAQRTALPLRSPAVQGAARSPDGATIALHAAGGLLVATAGGPVRLWSSAGVEQATACAPQNGGARVACVSGGSAVLYEAR